MIPYSEIQSLSPSAVWDGWVLDCTGIGGSLYRFYPGTNELGADVVWQGETYQRMPVEIDGVEQNSKGTLPRPTVRISNMTGVLSSLITTLSDLIGAKVTRKRTLVKYLDAVNFAAGVNPTADPTASWPDETFYIEQKTAETAQFIEWQIVSALDCQGMKLPRRLIQATVCGWDYNKRGQTGQGCNYAGNLTTCGKTLNDCKKHFSPSTGLISLAVTSGAYGIYTRTTGSFIDDGFQVGDSIEVYGFANALNCGLMTVSAVSALTITVAKTLVTSEGAAGGRSILINRPLPFGGFPSTSRIR